MFQRSVHVQYITHVLCTQNMIIFDPQDLSCGKYNEEFSFKNEEMEFFNPSCSTPSLMHTTPEVPQFSPLSPIPSVSRIYVNLFQNINRTQISTWKHLTFAYSGSGESMRVEIHKSVTGTQG